MNFIDSLVSNDKVKVQPHQKVLKRVRSPDDVSTLNSIWQDHHQLIDKLKMLTYLQFFSEFKDKKPSQIKREDVWREAVDASFSYFKDAYDEIIMNHNMDKQKRDAEEKLALDKMKK